MSEQLNAHDVGDVLDEFGFGDGTINASEEDAQRMAEEVVRLRYAAIRHNNTQGVLDAYKAHHEHFHPDCNISGPSDPPRPSRNGSGGAS